MLAAVKRCKYKYRHIVDRVVFKIAEEIFAFNLIVMRINLKFIDDF